MEEQKKQIYFPSYPFFSNEAVIECYIDFLLCHFHCYINGKCGKLKNAFTFHEFPSFISSAVLRLHLDQYWFWCFIATAVFSLFLSHPEAQFDPEAFIQCVFGGVIYLSSTDLSVPDTNTSNNFPFDFRISPQNLTFKLFSAVSYTIYFIYTTDDKLNWVLYYIFVLCAITDYRSRHKETCHFCKAALKNM